LSRGEAGDTAPLPARREGGTALPEQPGTGRVAEAAQPVRPYVQLGNGYVQLTFDNFKDFVDYLYSDLLNFATYLWRGHRVDSWKLETTIDRLVRNTKTERTANQKFERNHLDAFKLAARGRRGHSPQALSDENEWWALGQHYGLATPLLDWTSSPFVAAFFAFSELGSDQSEYRAIFALHQLRVEQLVASLQEQENRRRAARNDELLQSGNRDALEWAGLDQTEPELVFVRPQSDENQRLVSQSGLFTRSRTLLAIEDWVTEKHPDDREALTLIKVRVPDSERARCLQLLNRMNINPLSLFPDLSGASSYCNLYSEVENY
jgi:hypothetical protein